MNFQHVAVVDDHYKGSESRSRWSLFSVVAPEHCSLRMESYTEVLQVTYQS